MKIKIIEPKDSVLTEDSVISSVNLGVFLSLQNADKDWRPEPGEGDIGPCFRVYLALCKTQARNIVRALSVIKPKQASRYETVDEINFPSLIHVLIEDGNLAPEEIVGLLNWYRKVNNATFHQGKFVGDTCRALVKYLLYGERERMSYRDAAHFIAFLYPAPSSVGAGRWKWAEGLVMMVRDLFPKNGFTYRCLAEHLEYCFKYDKKGVRTQKDLQSALTVLKTSYETYG